ncbi:hypothetical protein [Calycomorphotria hydatis]|uniref:Uncharacterized protein n=1 Tax=Calycomorphotria hydatis TaxID=2528027 RepID=A0A517TAT6_9PLAN|nr:hypothetical protein [Calycomorphotria hydatis]QDT65491.1 hypothetical protein V22_27450 [Calycomorphotria hydatis]
MRKRGGGDEGGASLDSLLDTMFNVVGILVILLVVTQLGASEAVRRITGIVSEQELKAAQADYTELKKLLEENQADWAEMEARPDMDDELSKINQRIKVMQLNMKQLSNVNIDTTKLVKEVKEKQKEEDKLKEQIDTKIAEIEKIKAMLADTPKRGPDPADLVVSLPNPRPAPKGAEAVDMIIAHDRVQAIDKDQLQKVAQSAIKANLRSLINPKDNMIDGDKLVELFEKEEIGNRLFRLKINVRNFEPRLALVPKPDAGFDMQKNGTEFRRLMGKINDGKSYVKFRVYNDSFDTYLAAREFADQVKLPAGWLPQDEDYTYILDLGVKPKVKLSGYKPPPPPDPNAPKPPPPAKPKNPPPPKKDID